MDIETDSIIANHTQEDIKYMWKQLKVTQKYKYDSLFFIVIEEKLQLKINAIL